jgi:hypothetical protein
MIHARLAISYALLSSRITEAALLPDLPDIPFDGTAKRAGFLDIGSLTKRDPAKLLEQA